jgi:steroid delta-isomerase-like uncharacterized protein
MNRRAVLAGLPTLALLTPASLAHAADASKQNLQTLQENIDAWNAGDARRVSMTLTEDYAEEADTLPTPTKGRVAAQQVAQMYMTGFPDLKFEVEQQLAIGNHTVLRWHATGTQTGEFAGIPPTRKKGNTHGCTVSEYRDGKIARAWVYWDALNLMRQLGVIPAPPAKS